MPNQPWYWNGLRFKFSYLDDHWISFWNPRKLHVWMYTNMWLAFVLAWQTTNTPRQAQQPSLPPGHRILIWPAARWRCPVEQLPRRDLARKEMVTTAPNAKFSGFSAKLVEMGFSFQALRSIKQLSLIKMTDIQSPFLVQLKTLVALALTWSWNSIKRA